MVCAVQVSALKTTKHNVIFSLIIIIKKEKGEEWGLVERHTFFFFLNVCIIVLIVSGVFAPLISTFLRSCYFDYQICLNYQADSKEFFSFLYPEFMQMLTVDSRPS